ncbi:MAG: S4 domain-containing protein [Gammaproteobacteria bacterium]
MTHTASTESIRLDKWLWAARFFKTRAIAKTAIARGKVLYDGQRPKPGKIITVGSTLTIRQSYDLKTVIVERLSAHRGPATEAQKLYTETAASIAQRTQNAAQRHAAHGGSIPPSRRPSKRDRKLIKNFLNQSVNKDDNAIDDD